MPKTKYIYIISTLHIGYQYGTKTTKESCPDGIYRSLNTPTERHSVRYISIISNRTWGWFTDYETAEKSVLENWGDIYEGCYNYAVIEKVPEGTVTNAPEEEHWFKWKGKARNWRMKGGYEPCNKPKHQHNIMKFWG